MSKLGQHASVFFSFFANKAKNDFFTTFWKKTTLKHLEKRNTQKLEVLASYSILKLVRRG